ncbi:hypothetical protein ACLOJK_018211 [Asimina triloba]
MHAKSDSEVTSLAPSSPARSPRRPLYYVQSPSQHDAEKMSFQSSPMGSPAHHHFQYHCSPIHHSRESSTTRFSASLKNPKNGAWRRMTHGQAADGDDDHDEDDEDGEDGDGWKRMSMARFYFICFLLSLVLLFTAFSLILWGASKPYKPRIVMKKVVFDTLPVFFPAPFECRLFAFQRTELETGVLEREKKRFSNVYLLSKCRKMRPSEFTDFVPRQQSHFYLAVDFSAPFLPRTFTLSIVFESFNVQAGMDGTGVPTKMLSLNSTVRIFFRNPATFFGVHVTSTPLELYYYQLQIASGNADGPHPVLPKINGWDRIRW